MCPCHEREVNVCHMNAAIKFSSGWVGGKLYDEKFILTPLKVGQSSLMSGVELELDVALSLGSIHAYPKQPWESNIFLRQVFGDPTHLSSPALPSLRSLVVPPPSKRAKIESLPVCQKKIVVRDGVYDQTQQHADAERASALMKRCDIFMLDPEATPPGKMLLRCAGSGESAMRVMEDLFRKKATSTIKQRVGSLGLFLAWFKVQKPSDPFFPIDEEALYEYACDCRDHGKSASRVETLLGTLKYVGNVFQFPGALEAAASPRVEGASHGLFLTKAPRVRAKELSPSMLCWLEVACFALPSTFDRVVAGLCMLCAMGRMRASDANRLRHASLIGRYYEGALSRTKTAKSKEKATSFLSLVCPAFGLLGRNWLHEFLLSRSELGLDEVPSLASRSNDVGYVLVPSASSFETGDNLPMKSSELSDRLRAILGLGFSQQDIEGISSHSLKATLLSYMNVWGSTFEVNEILGFHVNKEHGSALNYTRDALSHPIRKLVCMLADVHDGRFVPDAPRDHVFPQADMILPMNQVFEQHVGNAVPEVARIMMGDRTRFTVEEDAKANDRLGRMLVLAGIPRTGLVEHLSSTEEYALYHPSVGVWNEETQAASKAQTIDSSSSSSEESDSSSGSSSEEEEQSHALLASVTEASGTKAPSGSCDTMRAFRHSRTRMLHYGHVLHSDKTGCGRLLSEAYYVFSDSTDLVYPKCQHCFGHYV